MDWAGPPLSWDPGSSVGKRKHEKRLGIRKRGVMMEAAYSSEAEVQVEGRKTREAREPPLGFWSLEEDGD